MANVNSKINNDNKQNYSKPSNICCPKDKKFKEQWIKKLKSENELLKIEADKLTRTLRIISNHQRLKIFLMLNDREHCLEEMAIKLNIKKSAMFYHTKLLKDF